MFDKDLGYLDKFFDKLHAHADNLEPQAGAQLRSLIDEERTRWKTITALVNGSPPESAPQEGPAPEPAAEPARSARDERHRPPHKVVSQPAPPPPESSAGPMTLTVGSLIKG